MTQTISDARLWDILNKQGLATGPRPAERQPRKRKNDESASQKAVFKWWKLSHAGLGLPECLLFSIPNGGGYLGPIVGARLKAEGLRRGVPDIFLAASNPMLYHGLFIEMKTQTGRLSPEQTAVHAELTRQGYKVCVCRSYLDAIKAIEEYLR